MSSLYLNRINPLPPIADELFYLGYNQDFSCLASGTANGFRIFNCDPFKETFKRDFSGGIGMIEMLFRCNILAIVGGGSEPAFPKNKVILWDDNQSTPIGELSFKSEVKAVKLRRDKIIVVLEKHVYVYNFEKLERIKKFDTISNNKGLIAVSPIDQCVIAFPHTNKGVVNVQLMDSEKQHLITAHDGNINCLALNPDGSKLATASEKGTLIRIFDTYTGQKIQEVRRGADRAAIYSIAWSPDSSFFCTSSDKGTIHIFAHKKIIDEEVPEPSPEKNKTTAISQASANRKSKISFFGGYFGSEWSFAWFRGPECPSVCCFGQDNKSVIAFTADGSYMKLLFDSKKGGECQRKSFSKYYKKKEAPAAK
jgi:WD40 repeat protein